MIQDRQDLANWALRNIGGGVVNVEISEEQMEDNIDTCIQYYQERHYDGVERDYYVRQITGTVIHVAHANQFVVGHNIYCDAKQITANIVSVDIANNNLTLSKTLGPYGSVFAIGDTIYDPINPSHTDGISRITFGDVDLGYLPMDPTIVGVTRVLNITTLLTSQDYLFNANYQIMMSEMQNLTSGGIHYMYGMLQYLGELDYVLKKSKDFRFNRRWGKVYLDINWEIDVYPGMYIALEVYKALDDSVYPQMLNDRWLKKYVAANFKRQWGQNLSKYDGAALPGGLTYNGKYILEQAKEEIAELEKESDDSAGVLGFIVG